MAPDAKTNTGKTAPTAATRPNRLPAPTLFVGPPSRNASQLSLSKQPAESSAGRRVREPLTTQKSNLLRPSNATTTSAESKPPKGIPTIQLRKPSDRSLETRWREMQDTLNEVEMTAQTSTHVFSEKHTAALDELRRTQVELARAWGRGSDETNTSTAKADASTGQTPTQQAVSDAFTAGQRKRGDTTASVSTQLSGESEASGATVRSGRSHLEDDATEDIRLANERRVANEAYFKKIDENVKDVVTKLEAVAAAMRDVEAESRSLWSETSSSARSEGTEYRRG